jgi:hypothetical protein
MQYPISSVLLALLLPAAIMLAFAHIQIAQAEPANPNPNPIVTNQTSKNQPNPFELVSLAYQGYFQDQGIPTGSILMNAISAGTLTAQTLIQAAVKANRLPEQTLNDQDYRDALDAQLHQLAEN